MANSVNTAFNEFNRDKVNLLKDRTDKARSSRTWLLSQLNGLESKADLDFPFKYESNHINFGSFERRTKIRELDDVDLMFCLTQMVPVTQNIQKTYIKLLRPMPDRD